MNCRLRQCLFVHFQLSAYFVLTSFYILGIWQDKIDKMQENTKIAMEAMIKMTGDQKVEEAGYRDILVNSARRKRPEADAGNPDVVQRHRRGHGQTCHLIPALLVGFTWSQRTCIHLSIWQLWTLACMDGFRGATNMLEKTQEFAQEPIFMSYHSSKWQCCPCAERRINNVVRAQVRQSQAKRS